MRLLLQSRVLFVFVLATTLVASAASAKRKKNKRPASPAAADTRGAQEILDDARTRYANLEYDKVLPLANLVLTKKGLTADQRLDAYVLQGSALAIVGDNIEAEKSFRLVLQERPDFDLPADTSPRILSILRKVQAEVNEMRTQARKARVAKVIASLALKSDHPSGSIGGEPLEFAYRFKDPEGAIEIVRVQYKKAGDAAFSSLPLERNDEGVWMGSVTGEWTANESGLVVEFFVETASELGPLLIVGSKGAPLTLDVAVGTAVRGPPPPLPSWGFWTGVGATTVTLAAAAGFGLTTLLIDQELTSLYNASIDGPAADGAVTEGQLRPAGEATALTANILYITAGALAVTTLVAWPFTNFE